MKHYWKKTIKINKHVVGHGHPTFITAEAGVNHNGKISYAKKLVDAAINCNANAVKFQTYVTRRLVSKKLLPQMYKMLKKYEFGKEDFEELKDYSKSHGMIFSSTPFDTQSCDLLEKLHVPFYKMGSGDLENIPLIMHASKKKKPLFISTGMSTGKEITDVLNSVAKFNNQVVLMHCTSIYPAHFNEANLNVIRTLQKEYSIPVGYSDHTIGYETSIAAVCLGACVIEKHLTLDNKMKGPDHKTSLNPPDFKSMVSSIRNVEQSFGSNQKNILTREQTTKRIARRSVISIRDIPKGKTINSNDVDVLRPYGGLPPKYMNKIIGKKAKTNIPKDKMIAWKMLY